MLRYLLQQWYYMMHDSNNIARICIVKMCINNGITFYSSNRDAIGSQNIHPHSLGNKCSQACACGKQYRLGGR